jgi:hypothetical protein
MKMIFTAALLVLTATFAYSQTPQATVRAFYAYSNSHSSTFNLRHIESRKQWFTPALYKALRKQLSDDAANLKVDPDQKPLFGDGLTFRPLDEPCQVGERSYKRVQTVGRTEIIRSTATVDVTFAYPKACVPATEPILYQVNLRRIGGRWLIDNFTYDDGSTLIGDMKSQVTTIIS